jgi:uroporphyrinogen-III synthase
MRVVVTRPEIAALRTAERLRALGHEPILLPLTRAVHHPDVATLALKDAYSALAMTSAEAARTLAGLGETLTPNYADVLYAVGEATARAASEVGFRDIRTGAGTGSHLAELIAADKAQLASPLLYLTGKPRSTSFEEGLRLNNVPFTVAEIYEMRPIAHDDMTLRHAFIEQSADAVLLYSRENARLFFDMARSRLPALPSLRVLCLSAKVADIVPHEFHRNIKIADHPDEEGLLGLL